jgi:gluconolactonase
MIRTSGIRNEFEIHNERFLYLVLGNAWVEQLYTGTLWAEGPVYFAVVADDFNKPNGIAFSPDEKTLYVVDTGLSHTLEGEHHIRAFSVDLEGRLSGGSVFAEISPGLADGLRVDIQGNVWTSAGDGIHCYTPEGGLLGKILVPEPVSNLAFGGPKRNRLFITATTSLYSVYVGISGAQRP